MNSTAFILDNYRKIMKHKMNNLRVFLINSTLNNNYQDYITLSIKIILNIDPGQNHNRDKYNLGDQDQDLERRKLAIGIYMKSAMIWI